jgi:hypothetical protein
MSGQPTMISTGHVAAKAPSAGSSVWSERAGRYAVAAVANAETAHEHRIERRLDRPSRTWTASEVVRSYRSNADGERRYREEAVVLTLHGYQRWLETAHPGHPLGGRMLMDLPFGGMDPSGQRGSTSRMVTWTKESAT